MSASALATARALVLPPTTASTTNTKAQSMDEDGPRLHQEVDIAIDTEESTASKGLPDEDVEPMAAELSTEQQLQEQAALGVDAQLRAMAVSGGGPPTGTRRSGGGAATTDTAPSTATSTGTRSAGESIDDVNGKDVSILLGSGWWKKENA